MTLTDQRIDEMMQAPDATKSRKHLERVLDGIETAHGARVFWRMYSAFYSADVETWRDVDRAVTSAGQIARGADLLAPDIIAQDSIGGVDPSDYANGRRHAITRVYGPPAKESHRLNLERLAERAIKMFDTSGGRA